MKYVPNMLSFMRLILLIPLMLLTPFELSFMIIYVVAGVTDMIDGPIARKFDVVSQFGATLDASADILFIFVVLFRILPLIDLLPWMVVWIVIIIIMKALSSIIGYIRHKRFILLHTYANKFFVFALFLFPIFFSLMETAVVITVLLVIATIAFAEDIYINATSIEVDLDEKGILFR